MDTLKNIAESLSSDLECPVCMEYLKAPITMCENGHNICGCCKTKLHKCPVCKGHFLKVRNLTLEKVVTDVPKPCQYFHYGCTVCLTSNLIQEHEEDCEYSVYQCPIRSDNKSECHWLGSLTDMRVHVKTNHKNKVYVVSDTNRHILCNVKKGRFFDGVIFSLDEIFYYILDCKPDGVFSYIKYVGKKRDASKYKYKLSLEKLVGIDKITTSRETNWCMMPEESIYSSGKCLKIGYDIMEPLLVDDDKKLCLVLKLSKAGSPLPQQSTHNTQHST